MQSLHDLTNHIIAQLAQQTSHLGEQHLYPLTGHRCVALMRGGDETYEVIELVVRFDTPVLAPVETSGSGYDIEVDVTPEAFALAKRLGLQERRCTTSLH